MKKIVCLLIVGIFVLSGLGASVSTGKDSDFKTIEEKFVLSQPSISGADEYIRVDFDEANSFLLDPGKPLIPAVKKTYVLPFGTKIENVEFVFSDVEEQTLSEKIKPCNDVVVPINTNSVSNLEIDESVYNSDELYPKSWYNYNVGSGLEDGEHVLFLTVNCYPMRYSPVNDIIYYLSDAEIKVEYQEPTDPNLLSNDAYDLLIIAPNAYIADMETFVEHKESFGVKTKLVSLDDAYFGTYFDIEGRDNPEKVKYFIKNAIEEWGIKYVLLVGGRKSGPRERWHMPVRYVDVFWADEYEYVSDLYFADIYNGEGEFSTWDTDENDVFSEWARMGGLKDEVDLYPDVYLGRWAARNRVEVLVMIKKTMDYENSRVSKNAVLVGGDNFEYEGIEGEIVCDKTLTYLPGHSSEKVYASNMDVTADAIRNAVGDGALFIHLHGHGSPVSWSTHKPDNFNQWEEGINVLDYPLFFNNEYSIAVIGGCHTAMFNVSMTIHPWGPASPEGVGWWFARKIGGGGIAALGYTCFPVATPGEDGDLDGDGVNDPDCAESGYGYMQLQLFKAYGIEGKEFLGECWAYAENKYIENFKTPEERYHLHTMEGFVLLGDPSLKIGGYGETSGLKVEIIEDGNLVGIPNVPVKIETSVYGGKQPYTYSWDLDEDGIFDDASGDTIEWTWIENGVYWVSVKVVDDNGKEKTYHTIANIELKPDRIQGSETGKPGVEYTYSIKATDDSKYNEIYYYIDWGDGNLIEIKGPFNSNNPITAKHSWSKVGSYNIKVKALLIEEDGTATETAWSDPLTISISKSKISRSNILLEFLDWLIQRFSIISNIM